MPILYIKLLSRLYSNRWRELTHPFLEGYFKDQLLTWERLNLAFNSQELPFGTLAIHHPLELWSARVLEELMLPHQPSHQVNLDDWSSRLSLGNLSQQWVVRQVLLIAIKWKNPSKNFCLNRMTLLISLRLSCLFQPVI